MVIAAIYVFVKFNTLLKPISTIKIVLASIIIYTLTLKWQFSGILLSLSYILMFIIYFGLLFILKEIKKEDINTLTNIIPSWFKGRFLPNN